MAVLVDIQNSESVDRVSVNNEFEFIVDITGDPLSDVTDAVIVYNLDSNLTYVSDDYGGVNAGQNVTFTIGTISATEEIQIKIRVKMNTEAGVRTNTYSITSNEYNSGLVEYDWDCYLFAKVGYFPQDVKYIGQQLPCALIEPSTETAEIMQGGLAHNQMLIGVYVFNNYNAKNVSEDEVEFLFKLQNDALYQIISDLRFNDNIDCVEEINVEKGENSLNLDEYNINYSDNYSIFKITFLVNYRESRS